MRAVRAGLILALGVVLTWAAPGAAQRFEPMPRAPGVRFPTELAARAAASMPILADVGTGTARAVQTAGAVRILALPALFEDSPEPTVSPARIHQLLFDTAGRTLTTFYDEMSGGRLEITGTVPDWVRTDVTVLEAAGSVEGHGFIGDSANAHFTAALEAADPMVDFTLFDNDGPDGIPNSGDDDGVVDAITFKFAEVAGSCGGPGFWPHASGLQGPSGEAGVATQDIGFDGQPIRVFRYTTESVVECDGTTPQGPATMAHEFGHTLGLPDFYRAAEGIEATQRHWMIGCFGLMAAGSWGCGNDLRVWGFGPTGLSPLSRIILGWADTVSVEDVRDTTFVLQPVQAGGRILRVRLTENWNEYYLIEYRPQRSFDDQLPAGGVLVYHVDEEARVLGGAYSGTDPYWLVEADASGSLRRTIPDGGDRGVPEDVFARGGVTDSLTPATTPATLLVSGEPSQVWIRSMSVADDQATIRLSTISALAGVPVSVPGFVRALTPMAIRFRIEGGTPPYAALAPSEGLPVQGLETRMDGDEVVVEGVPLLGGRTVRIPVYVRDSRGDPWYRGVEVEFGDVQLTESEIMGPLIAPSAATADVRTYLDQSGNADGTYDVGDLRAYVQRGGAR